MESRGERSTVILHDDVMQDRERFLSNFDHRERGPALNVLLDAAQLDFLETLRHTGPEPADRAEASRFIDEALRAAG